MESGHRLSKVSFFYDITWPKNRFETFRVGVGDLETKNYVHNDSLTIDLLFFPALDDLKNYLENPDSMVEMKFLLLEQKYLELISKKSTIDALKVSLFLLASYSVWKWPKKVWWPKLEFTIFIEKISRRNERSSVNVSKLSQFFFFFHDLIS